MADGSIVIDTRLDNKGFQSGSTQMRNAINGLQSTVNTFGQQAQASISAIAPALQNAARQAQTFSSSMTETEFQKNLGSMATATEKLQSKIDSLQQRANQGFSTAAQAQKWQSDLEKTTQEMHRLQDTILAIGQVEVKSDGYTALEREAEKLEAQIQKLEEKQELFAELGVDENSNSWRRLVIELDNATNKLGEVDDQMVAMRQNGTAFTQGSQTGAYTQAFMGLDSAVTSMKNLSSEEKNFASTSQQATSSASTFGSAIRGIGTNASTIAKAGIRGLISILRSLASSVFSGARSAISGLASVISSTLGAAISGAKSLLSGFASTLSSVGRTALSTASHLSKLPFKALSSGVNIAKKALSSFSSKTNSTTLTTNGLVKSLMSVKRMLISRVKRMFITSIFKSVQASLHNIAKASAEFNRSMSNIKNSATAMGGNLAVTFSNLVNAIAPALSTIIDWLSTALTYLNSFFAMLSGKTSVMVAKKSTDDYAKSLKDASSAAKDLNHQVYGFDELTKQESDNSSNKSSTGASFEEKDIANLLPESIQNLFESIKDAIANQNWEQVGALVANGLNWIVTSVDDWINNTLRLFGVEWAGNIARILNGLVDEFDFAALGDFFADGLNTILDIGYTFLTTFNWARLGEQLANGVNSLVDNIEWDLVGNFFAAKWNAVIDTVSNFFKNLDWADIGIGLSTGMNTLVSGIHWAELSEGLSAGLNGITTTIQTFIETFNWDNLATQFKTSVNGIISDVDWANMIYTVSEGFYSVLNTFYDIIAGINWTELATKFAKGVNRVFGSGENGISWTTLAGNITSGVNKITDAIKTFLETVDWDQMTKTFSDGINKIVTGVNWGNLIFTLVLGLFRIIATISATLASINWDSLATSFANGVNKVFGKDAGGNPNINWDKLTTDVSTAINGIVNGVKTFLETVDWDQMATTFGEGINNLISKIDWATMIWTIILGLFRIVATIAATLASIDWESLAKSFADGVNKVFGTDENGNPNINWDKLTTDVSTAINGIVSGIKTFLDETDWDAMATTVGNGINGLISKIDWVNLILTVALGLYSIVNTIIQTIANIKWEELGASLAEGLNKIFGKSDTGHAYIDWNGLAKNFSDAILGIIKGIDTFITETDWKEVGTTIATALGNIDWVGIATKLLGLLWDAIWGAVELMGGLTQRLVELIFGTADKEIVVPDIFTEDVEQQIKEQAGEAGEQAAWEMYGKFVQSTTYGTEDAQAAVIASAALIGTGFQDEMYKWLEDGDWSKSWGEEYSNKANELFRAITLEDATVGSVKASFSAAGITVTNGFAESILGAGKENIGAALLLLGAGVDQDTIAALDMSNLHTNLMAYMNESGKDLETVASELATNTGDALGRLLPEGMKSGLEASEEELQSEVDHIEEIASTEDSHDDITAQAGETGSDIDTELGDKITENVDEVGDAMSGVTDKVEDPLSTLPDNVKPYAENLMTAVTQAIVNGDPIAVAAIEAAANAVVQKAAEIMSQSKGEEITKAFIDGWNNGINNNYETAKTTADESAAEIKDAANDQLNYSNGYDIAESFIDGIDSGLLYNAEPVVTDIEDIGSLILAGIQDYVNDSNGETIGENMLIGMINGFNNYGQLLVDTMANICDVCVDTAREILGIASPSKVFERIGDYVMEGMQIGLEDTGEEAIGTVGDIASAMIEEAENGGGIAVQIDAMTDGLDSVGDKLTRIADIFIGITDSLTQMGGLTLPDIASGRVLPYGAQAAVNGAESRENGTGSGIEDALYNAFLRAQRDNSNGDPLVIKLEVDGRTLADITTKYQRQQARAWG